MVLAQLGIIQQMLDHIRQGRVFRFLGQELFIVVEAVRIEQAQTCEMAFLAQLLRCRRQ